ncbi:hypothetical protein BHM03_00058222 [Ensete ventricosum]|nr:hypothetical protein BHM03_00058222 [Ensete ventricosum]
MMREHPANSCARISTCWRRNERANGHLRTLAYKKVVAILYDHRRKLALNWEGPYRVVYVVREGTYTLAMTEGQVLPRT